jgi:hypothetical protein
MLNNATIAHLRSLKLQGFADALQQQMERVLVAVVAISHGALDAVAAVQRHLLKSNIKSIQPFDELLREELP